MSKELQHEVKIACREGILPAIQRMKRNGYYSQAFMAAVIFHYRRVKGI